MTGTWTAEGISVALGGFHLGPLDLALGPGETLAVIGRSGAGKTTLLRGLAGFLPLAAGTLRRDGTDIHREPPERRGTVYVPAGLGLFPDRTVRSNLAFPASLHGGGDPAGLESTARRFGIVELLDRYPRTLSEGQRERVAVARATLARPSLLLWDEPLGALDVESRRDLLEAIGEVREKEAFPIVLVTHDPALGFSLADRFLVLEAGRPKFAGTPEELVAGPVDPFVGRFVGYANVFEPAELREGSERSALARRLADSAGPGGVGAPAFPVATPASGAFAATVQRVVPNPEGDRILADSEGLAVVLSGGVGPPGSGPKLGSRLTFDIEPERLRRFGG